MLLGLIVIAVIVVAVLRGGSLRNFATIELRWAPLAIAGLVLQLLTFTVLAHVPALAATTAPLYLVSIGLLCVWVGLNWRIPGMPLIAAGLLLNLLAVAANGGHMPVDPGAARVAGRYDELIADDLSRAKHEVGDPGHVSLWLLTDIIGIPQFVPFAAIWSIGDVLLTLGIAILCYRTIRHTPTPRQQPAQ